MTLITKTFTTNNTYIKYKLFPHLNNINPYIFHSGYSFLLDFSLSGSSFTVNQDDYKDYRPNVNIYSTTLLDTKGTLVKIDVPNENYLSYFRNHTYVDLIFSTGNTYDTITYRTLIVDLIEATDTSSGYMIIETIKDKSDLPLNNIISINTVYSLTEISDILYEIYINEDNVDYYRPRKDNIRRNISNAYAKIISTDINIINETTGILMFDDQNKFILKLYDPENMYNGGILRIPVVVTNLTGDTLKYEITTNSAKVYGQVLSDGGTTVRERGIWYYYMTSSVDIRTARLNDVDSFKQPVSGTLGFYDCYLTNLSRTTTGKTYAYAAYATNSVGTGFGDILSFNTAGIIPSPPSVILRSLYNISYSTIDAEIDVLDVGRDSNSNLPSSFRRGVRYDSSPVLSGTTGIDLFDNKDLSIGKTSFTATGLTEGTVYYFEPYATNSTGTTYGTSYSGETLAFTIPTLSNSNVYMGTDMYEKSRFTGIVSNYGGPTGLTEKGIYYSSDTGATLSGITDSIKIIDASTGNTIDILITGLTEKTVYIIRSFATNSEGTGYGTKITFSTNPNPILPISFIRGLTSISKTSATLLTDELNGGSPITTRRIYYDTTTGVTLSSNYVTGTTTGKNTFTAIISGLTSGTTYYAMPYVENITGSTSGITHSFITEDIPLLDAPIVSNITINSATISTHMSSLGNSTIINRGTYYTTGTTMPTNFTGLTYRFTSYGNPFTINLTGLQSFTDYSVLSYASNYAGTGYSETYTSFKTLIDYPAPTVINSSTISSHPTTLTVTDVVSGNLITEKGLYYSTIYPVDIALTATTTTYMSYGSGMTWDIMYLTGLTHNTKYYLLHCATNQAGTTYLNTNYTTLNYTNPITLITDLSCAITTTNSRCEISFDGYSNITEKGIYYNTGITVSSTNGIKVDSGLSGTTTWYVTLTGLTSNTTYSMISYALNATGFTGYSNISTFVTQIYIPPIVRIDNIDKVGVYTSDIISNLVNTGNSPITERGIYYITGITTNVTSGTKIITSGDTVGDWTTNLTGLTSDTNYSTISYATNSGGTSYSYVYYFKTASGVIPLYTTIVNTEHLSPTSEKVNININKNGTDVISNKLYYDVSTVTTGSTYVSGDRNLTNWGATLTGLTPNTLYNIMVISENSTGGISTATSSFTTIDTNVPVLEITNMRNIGTNDITVDCLITSNGDLSITDVGVCYDGYTGGTITNCISTGITNSFTVKLTNLINIPLDENNPYFRYDIKAYAVNSKGTGYSIISRSNNLTETYSLAIRVRGLVSDVYYYWGSLVYLMEVGRYYNFEAYSEFYTNVPSYLWGSSVFTFDGNPYSEGVIDYTPSSSGLKTLNVTQIFGNSGHTVTSSIDVQCTYPLLYGTFGEVMPLIGEIQYNAYNYIYYLALNRDLSKNNNVENPYSYTYFNGTQTPTSVTTNSYYRATFNLTKYNNVIVFAYPSIYGYLKTITYYTTVDSTIQTVPGTGIGHFVKALNISTRGADGASWTTPYNIYTFTRNIGTYIVTFYWDSASSPQPPINPNDPNPNGNDDSELAILDNNTNAA